MAKRFFVDNNDILINGKDISVMGKEAHHINVLRHKIGDIITVNEYVMIVTNISKEKISGNIIEIEEKQEQENTHITLYQAYIKSDKMEYVVQKAVELGVGSIVPFLSKNCVVKLDTKDKIKKVERLNKISVEASKQCNRYDIALVEDVIDIKDNRFMQELNQNDINIFAYEKSENKLKDILENIKEKQINKQMHIGIIIGPEGGFDKTDIDVINKAKNMYEISLGDRILRAETASLNLLSILNYVFDN